MNGKPVVAILDASIATTGALVAVRREASLLADVADFILVLPSSSSIRAEDVPEFKELVHLPMVQLRRSLGAIFLYLPALLWCGWKLRRLLASRGCMRLQVNDFYLMQGAAARLLGYRGLIVSWIRIDPLRFGRVGRVWIAAMRRASDRVIAVSGFIARRLDAGAEAETLYDPYLRAPPEPLATSEQRLVFVGNYIEGKGQDQAIAAFARVAAQFPNARLEFHGGDMGLAKNRAYFELLKRQAAETPAADRILFGGFVEDSRAPLAGARAALTLSTSESFSLTCQEASACGLPVIATRCGGPEEIVEDGVTGYLVDVGDADATADRMARLLDDAAAASEMGARGKRRMSELFSAAHFRSRLIDQFYLEGTGR